MKGYAHSVIGSRGRNEDHFLIDENLQIFAVADGIGGGMDGDMASLWSIEWLKKEVENHADLKTAYLNINMRLKDEAKKKYGIGMMGTTLSTLQKVHAGFRICHVGDSRIYLFEKGLLTQLTEDQEYFDEEHHGHVLENYIGTGSDIDIFEREFAFNQESSFLLCTDGLYRQLDESDIVRVVKDFYKNPSELTKQLCMRACESESSDNVTALWVTCHK